MRVVTVYEANDGSQWPSIDQAMFRDLMLLDCAEATQILGDAGTLHRGQWRQHARPTVLAFVRRIYDLSHKYGYVGDAAWHPYRLPKADSIVARMLSDSQGRNPIDRLWYRYGCIDRDSREWEQWYDAHAVGAFDPNADEPTKGPVV